MLGEQPSEAQAPAPSHGAERGRRRRLHLWEPASTLHCPLIGTCLSPRELARIARRHGLAHAARNPYELHVHAVGSAAARSDVSRDLQRYLHDKYAAEVERFSAARDAEAVLALWKANFPEGEVAGSMWAALTHAAADEPTRHAVYADVHRLSHRVGALQAADERRGCMRLRAKTNPWPRCIARRSGAVDRGPSEPRHRVGARGSRPARSAAAGSLLECRRLTHPVVNSAPTPDVPIIVVGAGLAGLTVALSLADAQPVLLLAKRGVSESASVWAQGGIAAALAGDDGVERHVHDTLQAGGGLVDERVARFVAERGAAAIEWLLAHGVAFSGDAKGPLGLHLTREGGHSVARIVHAADASGRAIQQALLARAAAHPNIRLREHWMAVDLIVSRHLARTEPPRCYGVYALDLEARRVHALAAAAVVLATGGLGKVYRYTSNPDTATGDGVAMAWRAGCRVANMEFVQFHPTCLYHPQERSFLITEALRGEGAVLRLPLPQGGEDGSRWGPRFMPAHDARAELAPRDIVARAIDFEMKRHGLDHVWLDATHLGESFLRERFPTIHARCLALGIDIARAPIPVVPAAHYSCGGVVTDLNGCTDLPGLYAVGECAYTGLHGANRLASNSLLECVVFGRSCAEHLRQAVAPPPAALPPWDESRVEDPDEQVVIAHNWDELRLLMWNYVGIVRTGKRLQRALARIELLQAEVDEYYAHFRIDRDLLELRNLLTCAALIVRSALTRQESRGLHDRRDYPAALPVAFPTVLAPPARTPR